ncbi:MAG: hypothetical protein ABSH08_04055 [Tepidisphaeraceae bacterium]|jgi:hypothetical protein
MPYNSRTFIVVIASPSDMPEERQAAKQVIIEWNDLHSEAEAVQLQPKMWETHTTPEMGRPQEVVNKQIIRTADLLIGMFWTKLGTSTGVAASGTVEEIEEVVKAGKPVHLYFSNRPIDPSKIDTKEFDRLVEFKGETFKKALAKNFSSPDELKHLVIADLTRRVRMIKADEAKKSEPDAETRTKSEAVRRRDESLASHQAFVDRVVAGKFYEMSKTPPILALSVIPVRPVEHEIDIKLSESKLLTAFSPLHTRSWDKTFGRKAFATLAYGRDQTTGNRLAPQTVTEIMSDGQIHAACWFYWSYPYRKDQPYPFHGDEDELVRRSGEYMIALKHQFGVTSPFYVIVSLLGVAGIQFLITHEATRSMDEESITVGPVTVPGDAISPDYSETVSRTAKFMQPLFDEIWQTVGQPGSPFYDRDGRFIFARYS